MRAKLVKLENGNWIRLTDVTSIQVIASSPRNINGEVQLISGVELVIYGNDVFMNEVITCKTDEEAQTLADVYAKKINQALVGPDGDENLENDHPESTNDITILPSDKLASCADVKLYVHNGQRYVRWLCGDESDEQAPKVLYRAPLWVWMLYRQGVSRGIDCTQHIG